MYRLIISITLVPHNECSLLLSVVGGVRADGKRDLLCLDGQKTAFKLPIGDVRSFRAVVDFNNMTNPFLFVVPLFTLLSSLIEKGRLIV
jgi:hypothetical protein